VALLADFPLLSSCCCRVSAVLVFVAAFAFQENLIYSRSSVRFHVDGVLGLGYMEFQGLVRFGALHISRFLICPIPCKTLGQHDRSATYIYSMWLYICYTAIMPDCRCPIPSDLCLMLSCVIYANVKYFEMPLPCERKQTEVHYKVSTRRRFATPILCHENVIWPTDKPKCALIWPTQSHPSTSWFSPFTSIATTVIMAFLECPTCCCCCCCSGIGALGQVADGWWQQGVGNASVTNPLIFIQGTIK